MLFTNSVKVVVADVQLKATKGVVHTEEREADAEVV